ncbi:MAG: exonuclease SbcCD subunit D [Erysipelotrichaceae bacterium]|nr:exonuclease SbcCD subunit D [Erysipelotrichaceae bacterium]
MRIVHTADWHLGKKVNEFSMMEDQRDILNKILGICEQQHADVLIVAGDVYDKAVPSEEAVGLLDDFLANAAQRNLKVVLTSGNHDSNQRIAYGSRLLARGGIFLSSVYEGTIMALTCEDEYGPLCFYLCPFLKPANVRRYHEDKDIKTYTDMMEVLIEDMNVNRDIRNVLVAHQFVTGAFRSDSEEINVGGLDNVDASVFEAFDYVALGHIHRPQEMLKKEIRYAGSILKYSFSEADYDKSVTLIDLKEKGNVEISQIPLVPLHDMKRIRGTYDEITNKSYYENTSLVDDYVEITLTDEEEVYDALGKLRSIYHGLMKVGFDNERTRESNQTLMEASEEKSPLELFENLYEKQFNTSMNEEETQFLKQLMDQIWEGNQ